MAGGDGIRGQYMAAPYFLLISLFTLFSCMNILHNLVDTLAVALPTTQQTLTCCHFMLNFSCHREAHK